MKKILAIIMENLRKQKGRIYGSKAMRLVLWRKKGASITFHDGYMKGTYEFSADELMMYPEMY